MVKYGICTGMAEKPSDAASALCGQVEAAVKAGWALQGGVNAMVHHIDGKLQYLMHQSITREDAAAGD